MDLSKRSSTGTTHFALRYVHDAIPPMKVTVKSLRVAQQLKFTFKDHAQAMS